MNLERQERHIDRRAAGCDSQWGRNQEEEVRDVSEPMLVRANATLPTGLPA